MSKKIVPIVIPAYEPDDRLIELVKDLVNISNSPIIVVNDGSGEHCNNVFEIVKKILLEHEGLIISHEVNRGKGRALKTAFDFIIKTYPMAIGCVTADSDGQHTPDCIMKITNALIETPSSLILGARDFSGGDIPWKSKFGNRITERVFTFVTGVHIRDTQTGLRAIPISFMKELLSIEGERFEFEIKMLIESTDKYPIIEQTIETVYDSVDNHSTHFNAITDSIKIYRILGKQFLKYVVSSFSASVIDLTLFTIMCFVLKNYISSYIAIATVCARIVSAIYNYLINYKFVFDSKEKIKVSGLKYFILAIAQMSLSAALVTVLVSVFSVNFEVVIKMIVDTILFFISYTIQQRVVFNKKNKINVGKGDYNAKENKQ